MATSNCCTLIPRLNEVESIAITCDSCLNWCWSRDTIGGNSRFGGCSCGSTTTKNIHTNIVTCDERRTGRAYCRVPCIEARETYAVAASDCFASITRLNEVESVAIIRNSCLNWSWRGNAIGRSLGSAGSQSCASNNLDAYIVSSNESCTRASYCRIPSIEVCKCDSMTRSYRAALFMIVNILDSETDASLG